MSVWGGVARPALCRMFEGCAGWAGALPQHRRRAVGEDITFIGLDIHRSTIAVAVAAAGRDGEVRFVGEISNETAALDKLLTRLARGGRTLRVAYEAGPCGYGIHRFLAGKGIDCAVVAPTLIPRRLGDRVKTDRRDAVALARLHRAGERTPVWVPDAEHEAMRDLIRARADMVDALHKARQRLSGFLLRHGRTYDGKRWVPRHRAWLADQTFPHPAQQVAAQEYLDAVNELEGRIERITDRIRNLLPTGVWARSWRPSRPCAGCRWLRHQRWWLRWVICAGSKTPAS